MQKLKALWEQLKGLSTYSKFFVGIWCLFLFLNSFSLFVMFMMKNGPMMLMDAFLVAFSAWNIRRTINQDKQMKEMQGRIDNEVTRRQQWWKDAYGKDVSKAEILKRQLDE